MNSHQISERLFIDISILIYLPTRVKVERKGCYLLKKTYRLSKIAEGQLPEMAAYAYTEDSRFRKGLASAITSQKEKFQGIPV